MHKVMNTAAMLRLRGIVQSRYGKGLQVSSMMNLQDINSKNAFEVQGDDLIIPIFNQEQFLGMAQISDGAILTQDEKLTLSQLVKMVLEPELYSFYLDQLAHNSFVLNPSSENVVSLHGHQNSSFESLQETAESDIKSNIFFLEGDSKARKNQVAVEIHDMMDRWAFLRFEDIQTQVHSSKDLKDLGSVTLFVENFEKLSEIHKDMIHEFLKDSNWPSEPLFLIGSEMSLQSLKAQDQVHPSLAQIMTAHQIEVARLPRDLTRLQECVDLIIHNDTIDDK